MCGILAIYNTIPNNIIFNEAQQSLKKLQNRGRDSYGYLLVNDINKISFIKRLGDIKINYIDESYKYKIVLGHNRYATSYSSDVSLEERESLIQPFMGENKKLGKFAIIHNGNINNLEYYYNLFNLEKNEDEIINDSKMLVKIIEKLEYNSFYDIIKQLVNKINGVFSIVFLELKSNTIYCFKDRYGLRPLCIGKNSKGYCIVSESNALCNYDYLREIENGEIVKINELGIRNLYKYDTTNKCRNICLFEYVYFLNKNSIFKNKLKHNEEINVEDIRLYFGKMLASEEKYIFNSENRKNIIIIGSPDTGIPSGKQFANSLDLNYKQFLVKKKTAGRSFILENNESRTLQVRNKFLVDTSIDIKDKIVFFIDDSLVRGNTIKVIVDILKEYEPKEIHIRISSPQVRNTCYYGIDIPTKEELIMNNFNIEQLEKKLSIDSLSFLSIDNSLYTMYAKLGLKKNNICYGCFNPENKQLFDF